MSSFKIHTTVETINSNGKTVTYSWCASQTSLTDVYSWNVEVSADARKFIWHPTQWTDYVPSSFAMLALISDADLDVELTTQFGNASVATNSFRLVKDTPFVLGADDSYYARASTTDSAFGGALGVIDSLRIDEPNSATVNLQMIMGV